MDREILERISKESAGVIDSTDQWHWVRVLGGFEMYVMKNDQSVAPHLTNEGFWESWITLWLAGKFTTATVFVDVGANTGYYSLLALKMGSMVRSIEANPDYVEMMKATRKRNGISEHQWEIHEYAASDEEGTATLYVPASLHGSASMTAMDTKWDYKEIEVETRPLQIDRGGHYIVKIDAEGAEEKIWRGMQSSLTDGHKPTILLEYTPGAYSKAFLDELENYSPLRWINHRGEEQGIDRNWIENQDDWFMMVLKGNYI